MKDNNFAALDFERFAVAVMDRKCIARISRGSVFRKAKSFLSEFRLARQFNRTSTYTGFFTSIAAVLHTIASEFNLTAWKKRVIGSYKARCNSYNPMDWLKNSSPGTTEK